MASYRFIFYSAVTLALFWIGHISRPEISNEFLGSMELWRDPILAGVFCGLGCSLLGNFILLNRIVFMSLAIAQGAGLGIFITFWVCALLGHHIDHSSLPFLAGLALAGLTVLGFTWLRRAKNISEESLIGLLYVVASGLILILGDRITQGLHDKDNLLFGNAVAVTPQDLHLVMVVMSTITLCLIIFRRQFLYVSADPVFMKTQGTKSSLWLLFLFLLFTLGITVGLKTLGALPIFGLILVPSFIGLKNARSIRSAFTISPLVGMALPVLGYYYSYLFNFPTGASLIFVSLLYLAVAVVERLAYRGFKKQPPANA